MPFEIQKWEPAALSVQDKRALLARQKSNAETAEIDDIQQSIHNISLFAKSNILSQKDKSVAKSSAMDNYNLQKARIAHVSSKASIQTDTDLTSAKATARTSEIIHVSVELFHTTGGKHEKKNIKKQLGFQAGRSAFDSIGLLLSDLDACSANVFYRMMKHWR